jgi:hypothetical protein
MNRLKTSLFTTLGLALLAGIASLAYQKGVDAQVGSTPVRVVNTALAPALARDVDRRQPYQAFIDLTTNDRSATATFPAVPVGKRLVIEYVAVEANLGLDEQAYAKLLVGDLGAALEMSFQSRGSLNGRDTYHGSQKVLVFADAGVQPSVFLHRNNSGFTATFQATLTGYLVDL